MILRAAYATRGRGGLGRAKAGARYVIHRPSDAAPREYRAGFEIPWSALLSLVLSAREHGERARLPSVPSISEGMAVRQSAARHKARADVIAQVERELQFSL